MAGRLKLMRTTVAAAFAVCCGVVQSFESVIIDGAPPLQVKWQPAQMTGARPAIIALHGCSGLYNSRGRFDDRYVFYAQHWNASGWHVVAPDSFGSRHQGAICAQDAEHRTIKLVHRRDDLLRTAKWLMARDDVDAGKIAVVGWSHGAMTALEALDRSWWASHTPAAIVTYYPGCTVWKKRPAIRIAAPLLMLLGEADDWTPAAPCKEFAQRFEPSTVTVRAYDDSHHGFDSRSPVRFRADVPSGVDKRGVHVGGNPAARAASLAELDRFLALYLQ